jgi:hypothetical protein
MNIYLVFCCYFDGRNMMLLMLVINTPPPSLSLSGAHSPCVTLVLSHHCGSTCGALFPSNGVRPLVSLLLVCDIGRVFLLSRALASIRVYYNFSSHDVIARYVRKFIETNTIQSKQSLCETIPNTRFFARYFGSNKFLINFLSFCFVSLRL